MSKDEGKGPLGRLWSGGQERAAEPERKVVALTRPVAEELAYVAFEIRDNAERLEIVRAAKPSRFPAYNYLLDISYDRFHQSAFSLVFTFMVVDVKGRNLAPIIHALNFGNCGSIVQFDKRQHEQPGKDEPLIESIEITTADELRDSK